MWLWISDTLFFFGNWVDWARSFRFSSLSVCALRIAVEKRVLYCRKTEMEKGLCVVVCDFSHLNFIDEWKMNKESRKIRFTLLLNTMTILPTKLYTLGYKDDGLYPHRAFILQERQTCNREFSAARWCKWQGRRTWWLNLMLTNGFEGKVAGCGPLFILLLMFSWA